MGRIFSDCYQMIREMDRELKVSGITVKVQHYQNIPLKGDNQITKELSCVNFHIARPLEGQKEMLEYIFGEKEAKKIQKYTGAEQKDRLDPLGLNPGKSWKIRRDLWQGLFSKSNGDKFDYTYSERFHFYDGEYGPQIHQIDEVVKALADDINTRRAMLMVFFPSDTLKESGMVARIPCSISYQFLYRNGALNVIYYTRSNDFYKHFPIDVILTAQLLQHICKEFEKKTNTELPMGALEYFAGSLHAYNEDLVKRVIY